MSSFTTPLKTRTLEPVEFQQHGWEMGWELTRGFEYDIGGKGGNRFQLRKGTRSNGASVPRWLWWLIHPVDPTIGKAAWIHDWLYMKQEYSKVFCDAVLADGMITLGAKRWKIVGTFAALTLFGDKAWKECQEAARKENPEIKLPAPVLVEDVAALSNTAPPVPT